jgi:hypothetical protein
MRYWDYIDGSGGRFPSLKEYKKSFISEVLIVGIGFFVVPIWFIFYLFQKGRGVGSYRRQGRII